jgi:phosphate transport system protein
MAIGGSHTMKSFDAELNKLKDMIARMSGLAEAQLIATLQAMTERDSDQAAQVVADDVKVDALERQASEQVMRLLALRTPLADDLRMAVTGLKLSGELERVADNAASCAKRVMVLNQLPSVAPVRAVTRMGWLAVELLKEVTDAYLSHDAERAMVVWRRDQELDDLYSSLFRELLTYMLEDPRNITACTHLMFLAKNIERIGDHATNIAEMTYFLVTGHPISEQRPKRDVSSSTVPNSDET